jgi:hypothetical protein
VWSELKEKKSLRKKSEKRKEGLSQETKKEREKESSCGW